MISSSPAPPTRQVRASHVAAGERNGSIMSELTWMKDHLESMQQAGNASMMEELRWIKDKLERLEKQHTRNPLVLEARSTQTHPPAVPATTTTSHTQTPTSPKHADATSQTESSINSRPGVGTQTVAVTANTARDTTEATTTPVIVGQEMTVQTLLPTSTVSATTATAATTRRTEDKERESPSLRDHALVTSIFTF